MGGFVLDVAALNFIRREDVMWERKPMELLAERGQLIAFKHHGFGQCMDTLRDKNFLESLWQANQAPWRVWR